MKTVIIHGQGHKGFIYHIAYELAEKRLEQQRCRALEETRLDREKAPLEIVRQMGILHGNYQH